MNNIEKIENDLDSILNSFKKELNKYSLNKINISLISDIKINYFNAIYKINQISSINIENQILIIKPFDKAMIQIICNEINKLNMDLSPLVQNDFIKIIFPKTTVERRNNYIKKIKEISENYKITIRNIRRDINNKIKLNCKNKQISQDEEKISLNKVQKKIDEYNDKLDEILQKKIIELNKL